ncbi:hypothetical protein HG542_08330 [Streptomyces morookaense]|uniref:Uncharacterized protein n=1 Tax=Streptomyces morookaense TaxID=1970 RepID=A0A7Y7E689_STRMO|nr:hypothetical protein [Streptomyces morookaense]
MTGRCGSSCAGAPAPAGGGGGRCLRHARGAESWRRGRTGHPPVDVAMRQLRRNWRTWGPVVHEPWKLPAQERAPTGYGESPPPFIGLHPLSRPQGTPGHARIRLAEEEPWKRRRTGPCAW